MNLKTPKKLIKVIIGRLLRRCKDFRSMSVLLYAYRTFEPGRHLKITFMRQVVIENPILNSPFVEPGRHFRFTDDGITDEIIEQHRISSYFIPIARPRSWGK